MKLSFDFYYMYSKITFYYISSWDHINLGSEKNLLSSIISVGGFPFHLVPSFPHLCSPPLPSPFQPNPPHLTSLTTSRLPTSQSVAFPPLINPFQPSLPASQPTHRLVVLEGLSCFSECRGLHLCTACASSYCKPCTKRTDVTVISHRHPPAQCAPLAGGGDHAGLPWSPPRQRLLLKHSPPKIAPPHPVQPTGRLRQISPPL